MSNDNVEELIQLDVTQLETTSIKDGLPYLQILVGLAVVIGEALGVVHAHARATGNAIPETLHQIMKRYINDVATLNLGRGVGTGIPDGTWEMLAVIASARARFRREIGVQFNAISKIIRSECENPGFNVALYLLADLDILIELATKLDGLMGEMWKKSTKTSLFRDADTGLEPHHGATGPGSTKLPDHIKATHLRNSSTQVDPISRTRSATTQQPVSGLQKPRVRFNSTIPIPLRRTHRMQLTDEKMGR